MNHVSFLAVLAITALPIASSDSCRFTVDRYNSALADISQELRRYTNCLNGNQPDDDCSSEFRRLRSAQTYLEQVVLDYGLYCRR